MRSGLYGAADADGDGQVSYREIAAFVTRANASVPNERYRPDVHARAPRSSETLLDLRRANGRRIEIDGKHAGHYYLEDNRGVRIADIHNAPDQTLSIMRPAPNGRVYLRRVSDDKELVIEPRPDVVSVGEIEAMPARVASRGAAHEAFNSLFLLPFDADVVAAYPVVMCIPGDQPPPSPSGPPQTIYIDRVAPANWRKPLGITLLGVGGVALATGALLTLTNGRQANTADTSQRELELQNDSMATKETVAGVFYVTGAVAIVTGTIFVLMPSPRAANVATKIQAGATKAGGFVGYGATF